MFYASRNEMEGNAQWNMDTLGSRYKVWVSQYPEKPFPETPKSSYSRAHDMWPVSYTHLDVYKRQDTYRDDRNE